MNATIHHRSLGVFPADKPTTTLQANRACQEFFDKVDIDRLRKLAKNLLPSEWKKDFDHRNNALLENYDKGILGDALRFKARLEGPVMAKCLTRFNIDWVWDGKPAIVQSRATDESGHVQPTYRQNRSVRGTRSIYHNNSIQSWLVQESGEVKNVQLS